ncbi:MAG: hypothetical protein GTN74_08055 [Proteobacteria bacterium]|nr:hypothetical protein [Pseudomonadota bacterium]NIS69760.1 hypothetical protein [Pseudomonadota bacterium]
MIQAHTEKRKHPRYPLKCPVSFIFFNNLKIGETSDLSLGGMKLRSRYMLFTGETYDFTVVVNGHAINPKGKIVYIENQPQFTYGTGVSFVDMSKDHHSRLSGFLSGQKQ